MFLIREEADTIVALIPSNAFKSTISRSFCNSDNPSENALNIYPNPVSSDEITIESTIDSVNEIKILDVTGKTFATYEVASTILKIKTDFLKQGMYLFEIKTKNQTYVKRVFIL
jgi:hypothetical protein